MRTVLFLGVGFLLLLGVGIPYVTGVFAEQQFTQLYQQWTQSPFVSSQDSQHQRGWLNSTASSHMLWQKNQGQVELQHQIDHGLLPLKAVNINTVVGLNEVLQQQLQTYLGDVGTPLVQTQITAARQVLFNLVVPRPDENQLPAVQGQFTAHMATQQVEGQLSVPLWQIPQSAYPVRSLNAQIQVQGQMLDEETFKAQAQVQPEQVQVALQHQADAELQAPELKLDIQIQGDLLNVEGRLLVPQLQAGEQQFERLELTFHGQQLDWRIVQELLDILKKPALQQRFMLPMFMLRQAKPFLSHQPSLHFKSLALHSSEGDLSGHVHLQVNPVSDDNPGNITALLQLLQSDIKLDMNKTLVEQILKVWLLEMQGEMTAGQLEQAIEAWLQEYVTPLEQRGWVRLEDGVYRVQFTSTPAS